MFLLSWPLCILVGIGINVLGIIWNPPKQALRSISRTSVAVPTDVMPCTSTIDNNICPEKDQKVCKGFWVLESQILHWQCIFYLSSEGLELREHRGGVGTGAKHENSINFKVLMPSRRASHPSAAKTRHFRNFINIAQRIALLFGIFDPSN